ncbi:MAG: hypothetical protein KDJ17_05550, partial [Hyphomicrobiaceae bacterium]|nr:hypothetical protein [Hyphomicrobiaceae bacterium]
MTRLDPTGGEPSMEEILASIRKIIAEDPPGSRPEPGSKPNRPVAAPEPNGSGLSSFGSALQPRAVSTESKDAAESTTAPASEGAQDVKAATASFFSHRPSLDAPRAQAEPQPTMKPVAPLSTDPFAAPPQRQVSSFDIDAQLADVLGGPAKTDNAQGASGPSLGTPAAAPPENSKDAVQGALDSLAAPAAEAAPAKAVASAPAKNPDPFEFSLGPSPFARKEMPQSVEAKPEPSKDIFGSFVPVREPSPIARSDFTPASLQPPPPAERSSQPDFSAMNSSNSVSQSAATETEPQDTKAIAPTEGSFGSQPVGSEPADDPFGEISFRPQSFGTSPAFPASSVDKVAAPPSSLPAFEPLEQLTRAAHIMPEASFGAVDRSQTEIASEQDEPEAPEASETIEDSGMDVQQTAAFETLSSDAHEPETEQEEKATAEETAPSALSDLAPRSFETASANVGGISAILTEMPSETSASDDADVEVVEPELENNSHTAQPSDESAQREMEADARMQS